MKVARRFCLKVKCHLTGLKFFQQAASFSREPKTKHPRAAPPKPAPRLLGSGRKAAALTYAEAIEFLYRRQMFGVNFGLETTRRLAAGAGNPQAQLRFIHVAGTNGKGSTCAMLESIYRAAGLRVGLFTSPHLVSFRERMQVNREFISQADVARLVAELAAVKLPDATTFFEFVTVLALKFFAEQKCDLVIWETGLGGRLDATNIVTPLASVITNIALDHTQWLGDTLEKIAAEKAGIIKPGVPIITGASEPEVLRVIEEVAQKNNSPLTRVASNPSSIHHPPSALLGDHQKQNAALAIATVAALQKEIPVSAEPIRKGLATVNWPGRLHLITRPSGQKILLDGAHNVAGAETLRAAWLGAPSTLIIGVLADKDWQAMVTILAPLASKIFTVPVASARTADASELATFFQSANPSAQVVACNNFSEALAASQDEPFVVVAGSLYLIGEALEKLGVLPADGGERGLNEWTATK